MSDDATNILYVYHPGSTIQPLINLNGGYYAATPTSSLYLELKVAEGKFKEEKKRRKKEEAREKEKKEKKQEGAAATAGYTIPLVWRNMVGEC